MDEANRAEPASGAVLDQIASLVAAQAGSENFPVALRLLPAEPRRRLQRVYAFARLVDDVGDEAPGDRLALLDVIDHNVRALWTGAPALPTVAALGPLVDECAVPIEPFLDLIEANRMDQRTADYESFDDLLGYCRLSAAPIGRIVLHVAGAATDQNVEDSDDVCNALQVLEHCQDVGEDARAGRTYLPAVDLRAAGVGDDDLRAPTTSAGVRRVVGEQVDRALGLLRAGRPLVRRLRGWPRLAVSGYVAGGLATATALRRADFDVLDRHIGPSKIRTTVHAVRLVTGA